MNTVSEKADKILDAKDALKGIPGADGWTKAEDVYVSLYLRLRRVGMDKTAAMCLLAEAYWAAASEYGA